MKHNDNVISQHKDNVISQHKDNVISQLNQIVRIYPWRHEGRELQKKIQRGYVYAIHEHESKFVFIGWGGTTSMNDTIRRLQKGNARILSKLCILQRDNVYDATEIHKFICEGLIVYKKRGNWYQVEHNLINKIFDNIDCLSSCVTNSNHSPLLLSSIP